MLRWKILIKCQADVFLVYYKNFVFGIKLPHFKEEKITFVCERNLTLEVAAKVTGPKIGGIFFLLLSLLVFFFFYFAKVSIF